MTGCVMLAVYVGAFIESKIFNAYQDHRLQQSRLEDGTRQPRRTPAEGELIGRLEIQRLGIRAAVVEGTSSSILRKALGHVPNTALPDQAGNLVIAGHRDTFFRNLGEVRPGDSIVLVTPDGEWNYVVEKTRITPREDLAALDDEGGYRLTLITCYPFRWVGPAPLRFIVQGRKT